MKATLVIDMPKNCDECQFNYDMGFGCDALDNDLAYGGDRKEMQGEIRPPWCPLGSKKNRAIPIEWLHSIMKKQLIFAMNSEIEGTTTVQDGVIHCVSGALACQVLANVIELWEKENE